MPKSTKYVRNKLFRIIFWCYYMKLATFFLGKDCKIWDIFKRLNYGFSCHPKNDFLGHPKVP